MAFVKMLTVLLLTALFQLSTASTGAATDHPKNVLFLPVDDFRPEIFSGYNQSHMITPNLNKLVNQSLVFQRAYCQQAVCIPSRNSFMTGKRPDTTKVLDQSTEVGNHDFRVTGSDWISLPEHFKKHGFTTLGGGKTYHQDHPPNWDEPKSWSQDQPYFPFSPTSCPSSTVGGDPLDIGKIEEQSNSWCPLPEDKYPDSYHYDWQLANHTINTLNYVKKKGGPWFIAAGFRRPHLPWKFPQRFWDMYNNVTIPTVLHRNRPKSSPDLAYKNKDLVWQNKKYLPMPDPFPVDMQQLARQAYMASVSWVDSQIGRVLDALDTMGLSNDTLVVLFGDHGYHLGELDAWCKQTNWELATRIPLIIRAPWKPSSQGKNSYALVESVDLYRTIADLVGAPTPTDDIEGTSFAPIFDNPSLTAYEAASVLNKSAAAYSQFLRCIHNKTAQWADNGCSNPKNIPVYIGYSVRTPEWRYTGWMPYDIKSLEADWSKGPYAVELYDHRGHPDIENDPNQSELKNEADDNKDIVEMLQKQLKDFFKKNKEPE